MRTLAIALVLLCSCAAFAQDVTFVGKNNTIYTFHYKRNTIKATCDFTSVAGIDGAADTYIDGCLRFNLLPGDSVPDLDSSFDIPQPGHFRHATLRRGIAQVSAQVLSFDHESCEWGTVVEPAIFPDDYSWTCTTLNTEFFTVQSIEQNTKETK
jgi:hypothetical protein